MQQVRLLCQSSLVMANILVGEPLVLVTSSCCSSVTFGSNFFLFLHVTATLQDS
jgi:hypothetical protein